MAYDIIKNNELVMGIFSLCVDPSRKEFFPPTTQNISINEGLEFVIGHFEEPIWPRTIFTKTDGNRLVDISLPDLPSYS
jgi:hypothetical protein